MFSVVVTGVNKFEIHDVGRREAQAHQLAADGAGGVEARPEKAKQNDGEEARRGKPEGEGDKVAAK